MSFAAASPWGWLEALLLLQLLLLVGREWFVASQMAALVRPCGCAVSRVLALPWLGCLHHACWLLVQLRCLLDFVRDLRALLLRLECAVVIVIILAAHHPTHVAQNVVLRAGRLLHVLRIGRRARTLVAVALEPLGRIEDAAVRRARLQLALGVL